MTITYQPPSWTAMLLAPWILCAGFECNAENSVIHFSEPFSEEVGFNGQPNQVLVSTDGQYRVEAFHLNEHGHFHTPLSGIIFCPEVGGDAEHNHNFSAVGGLANLEGIRISRMDGDPFNLKSMRLFGKAAVGQLSNPVTGEGVWTLFTELNGGFQNPAEISFGSAFENVTAVFVVDPFAADSIPGGFFDFCNLWDEVTLETAAAADTEPPVVECVPTTNPAGRNLPPAGNAGKTGWNPDGFYQVWAIDNVDGANLQIFIKDSAEGSCGGAFSAGPFPPGTKLKLTQSPGRAQANPMAGEIVAHIQTRGAPVAVVSDSSGNTTCEICSIANSQGGLN